MVDMKKAARVDAEDDLTADEDGKLAGLLCIEKKARARKNMENMKVRFTRRFFVDLKKDRERE
jgi:hypothetical protein